MTFCAVFENDNFKVKTAMASFWATFGKIGQLFIPSSGHTETETGPFIKSFNTVVNESHRWHD